MNNGVIASIQLMLSSGMNMLTNSFVLGDRLIEGSGGNVVTALNSVSEVGTVVAGSYVRVRTAQVDIKEKQQMHLNHLAELALEADLKAHLTAMAAKAKPVAKPTRGKAKAK